MRTLLCLLSLFITNPGFSQNLDSFRLDFKSALSPDFSADEFKTIFDRHKDLLSFYTYGYTRWDKTQTAEMRFPLRAFRRDTLYKQHIDALLSSDNVNQRLFAFDVIAAAGDSSMTKALLQRMLVEEQPTLLYWGGTFLFYLGCQETTPLFDLIVQHENFGDTYFIPLYTRLNKDSLLQTALHRIETDSLKAKVLAAYSLGFPTKTKASEVALRKAVREWDIHTKGYAIISLKQLRVGNLLSLLKPLLDNPLTKTIALEALIESPAARDVRYVKRLAEKEKPVTTEVLNCFYKSTKPEAVKYWLYLLRKKPLPEKRLWFSIVDQPLLSTDALLPDVRKTLKTTKNVYVLQQLSRALQGRTDVESVQLIVELLHHPDAATRYWVAEWNDNCRSPILANELPTLIADPHLRTSPLAMMAIENNLDTLQTIFEKIYQDSSSSDLRQAALLYLSTFPKPRYREMFRELLQSDDRKQSVVMARQAALGLGRLHDVNSDELIIQSSHTWLGEGGGDSNAYPHLLALEMLKTDKAKKEIQQYLYSKEKQMREFAQHTLDNW